MGYGHLVDSIAGTFSRALHVRRAQRDTSAELEPYLDLPIDRLFPAPPAPPSIAIDSGRAFGRGRVIDTLRWPSGHRPLSPAFAARHERDYAANQTAYVRWMHAPRGGRRRSLLVFVHGWLEPASLVEELTVMPAWYRALGIDIAHVQLPYHGRRSPRGQLFHGEWYWTGDLVRSLEAVRQSVYDTRSTVAHFRALGYEEIGVAGLSLGGGIAMLTACLEPLPDYIVSIVAHLSLLEAIEQAPIFWRMRADLDRFGVDEGRRRAIFERLAVTDAMPLLPPSRQLWVAAADDVFLRADVVRRQWERWGKPELVWLPSGHMTFPIGYRTLTRAMATMARLAER